VQATLNTRGDHLPDLVETAMEDSMAGVVDASAAAAGESLQFALLAQSGLLHAEGDEHAESVRRSCSVGGAPPPDLNLAAILDVPTRSRQADWGGEAVPVRGRRRSVGPKLAEASKRLRQTQHH